VTAAEALGYADLVAPPTFAAIVAQAAEACLLADRTAQIDLANLVHAEERIHHHRPISAGDCLQADLAVSQVTERAGLTLLTTCATVSGQTDQPVATVESTLAIRQPTDTVTMQADGRLAEVSEKPHSSNGIGQETMLISDNALIWQGEASPKRLLEAQNGDQSGPLSTVITRDALVRYAAVSGDFNPIHYNLQAALAAGLPGVIAHGMLMMGLAVNPVVDWAGNPGAIVDYQVRFGRPLVVPWPGGAQLTVTSQLVDAAETTLRLTVSQGATKLFAKALVKAQLPAAAAQVIPREVPGQC
jgi:acyl dehydratase